MSETIYAGKNWSKEDYAPIETDDDNLLNSAEIPDIIRGDKRYGGHFYWGDNYCIVEGSIDYTRRLGAYHLVKKQ